MTREVTVTVSRTVVETWHYVVDADAIGLPDSDCDTSAAEADEARSRIYEALHGADYDRLVVSECLNESDCIDLTIEEWESNR